MSQLDKFPTVNQSIARGIDRRRFMRPLTLAVPVALLFLLTACGGSTAVDPVSPAAGGSSSSPAAGESSAAGGDGGMVLTGVVGTEGDPDAFKITLVDSTGAPVSTLKADYYEVKIKDLSKIHNFVLSGSGVDEKTSVPEVTEVTWKITVVPGTYTYVCSPHPKMTGSFTVT